MSDPFRPYADLYVAEPQGPGDARPTALQVIHDQNLEGKWTGRVVLVTGGTAGLGTETVRALHTTGADVYFTARDATKGQATIDDVRGTSSGKGRLEVIPADFNSLSSVRAAAKDFLSRSPKLTILINNAGVMATPPGTRTKDGFEAQFGINHLAHHLLTRLLLPALEAGSTPDFNSRIVVVASSVHRYSQVDFADYNLDAPGAYEPYKAYSQSKTANIWMANYVDRVYGPRGVHATPIHPGGIWTNLFATLDEDLANGFKANEALMRSMQSPAQGAATTVWAATSSAPEGTGGRYVSQCSVAPPADTLLPPDSVGYAPWVSDVESQDKLWELSEKLVGTD